MICDNISINEKGHLTFANRDTVELAQKYGTPLYVMDEEKIREKCRAYICAMSANFLDSMPLFASKSCSFVGIYKIIKQENMGIDVVSSGELFTALKADFSAKNIFFHGNNKTESDIKYGMENKVGYFVCDNFDELFALQREAENQKIVQKILLRLTPGIDPHTHEKISTGKIDSKFGVSIDTNDAEKLAAQALLLKNIKLCGYHCHIGSQTFDTKPFTDAAKIMLKFSALIKEKYKFEAEILNLGGGIGVAYLESQTSPDIEKNIKIIADCIKSECAVLKLCQPKVLMEPGRSIVADGGMTLYTAGSFKKIEGYKNYVSVDGGMPDNPRYALYEAPYTIFNASNADKKADIPCSVVGRCCESGDILQENVMLPVTKRGDIIAVLTTGAYNYSMASNYNRIPRPPIVMLAKSGDYTAGSCN
ncbi:MAG: diaminopimelate decarboxylase [Clostridia bacterium]